MYTKCMKGWAIFHILFAVFQHTQLSNVISYLLNLSRSPAANLYRLHPPFFGSLINMVIIRHYHHHRHRHHVPSGKLT